MAAAQKLGLIDRMYKWHGMVCAGRRRVGTVTMLFVQKYDDLNVALSSNKEFLGLWLMSTVLLRLYDYVEYHHEL